MVWRLLIVSAALVQTAPTPSPWECRSATSVTPNLPVIRSNDDRRFNVQEWWYETRGQTVFGLRTTFLSYLRGLDGEFDMRRWHYTSIVEGDVNRIRWLVERASPDLRCLPNGPGFLCMVDEQIGTTGSAESPNERTVAIFPANGDPGIDGIATGFVVECSWERQERR